MRACEASTEMRRDCRSGRDTGLSRAFFTWCLALPVSCLPRRRLLFHSQKVGEMQRVYKCKERLLKAILRRSSAFLWCWFSVRVSQLGTRQQGRV